MTVSVESCFLVRSACHAIFCDTQGGFRWQPKQRTVARVPRYIQSLSKPTELFAAAPICLFIARLNFKCLLLSGCRGLSTLPRLSQVLSTLPWSSLGVPLALPWRSLGATSPTFSLMIKPLALRARGLSMSKSFTKIARRPRVPLDVPVCLSASPWVSRRRRGSLGVAVGLPASPVALGVPGCPRPSPCASRRLRGSLGISVRISPSPWISRHLRAPLDVPVCLSASPCASRRLRAPSASPWDFGQAFAHGQAPRPSGEGLDHERKGCGISVCPRRLRATLGVSVIARRLRRLRAPRRCRASLDVSVRPSTSPCIPRRLRVPLDAPPTPLASPMSDSFLKSKFDMGDRLAGPTSPSRWQVLLRVPPLKHGVPPPSVELPHFPPNVSIPWALAAPPKTLQSPPSIPED